MSEKPTAAERLYPTQVGVPNPSAEPHPLYAKPEPAPPAKSTREQFSAADFFPNSGYTKPEPPRPTGPVIRTNEDLYDVFRRGMGLPVRKR